jgi:hypothetical protein
MTETKKLTKDRSYYRKLSTFELWEITRYGVDVDWKELAIVLGERLGTIRDEVYKETERGCDYCGG